MRADAILTVPAVVTTSKSLDSDPTQAQAITPLDQVRHHVAAALFGPSEPVRQVGRFQIQKLLGAGGMGVVFAATDPQLGRTVALKLLQPMTAGERARERLLREAQAMARLQHPNVVGVYEAGVHGEQVYVVMEYVEDGTLADWLRARARGWQEVVGVLRQAGEGLAAAHAAGIVHRDFKPANVLMGAGRARISDFGLARTATTVEELERTGDDNDLQIAAPLTRTGALLGTPAYMAPEQIRGEPATPASDQFAFGVVLHEALTGHRPFQGASIAALLAAIDAGKLAAPARPLPPQLLAVIRRALAPEPARRFPDMPALLAALARVRAFHWRPALFAASAAAVMAGGLVMFSQPTAGACEADALAGVWDDERRVAVGSAIPEPLGAEVVAALDAYAADWRRHDRARCEAGEAALQWSATCLADRRVALADLTQALVGAPTMWHPGARAAVDMLPALADCAAPPKYTALVSEAPPDVRAASWDLRLRIARAFQPRVATRPVDLPPDRLGDPSARKIREDPRALLESNFADIVEVLHIPPPAAPAEPDPVHALLPGFVAVAPGPIDALPRLLSLAENATKEGHADLAARAWVLAAEVLEARPHADGQRKQVWAQAEQTLALLPEAHPVRRTLQRDLAYVQLTHARHVTGPGVCGDGGADFETCSALFSATKLLTTIAASDAATATDHELLARAHEHGGDARAAAGARARAGGAVLDERALGYLDFGAAAVVPDGPSPADAIRCDAAGTACEIDGGPFGRAAQRDPNVLFGACRHMPAVKDGVYLGHKLYGIRPGNPLKPLGFKNGDMITAIDGVPVTEGTLMAQVKQLLVREDGTLTFVRKGETLTLRLSIR